MEQFVVIYCRGIKMLLYTPSTGYCILWGHHEFIKVLGD